MAIDVAAVVDEDDETNRSHIGVVGGRAAKVVKARLVGDFDIDGVDDSFHVALAVSSCSFAGWVGAVVTLLD